MASALPSSSHGTKRALLIGNNDYTYGQKLRCCINDATDMSNKLRTINFEVTLDTDSTSERMKQMIDNFERSIRPGDLVVFYFAGHGIQWNDQNYLVPIDNDRLTDRYMYKDYAVNANAVLERIMKCHPSAGIFLLDCCRKYLVPNEAITRSPFGPESAVGPEGLAYMEAANGSFTAFACAVNKAAQDRSQNGRNGIFTAHLLTYITQPNVTIQDIMVHVCADVTKESNDDQWPFWTSSLRSKVYLNYNPSLAQPTPSQKTEGKLVTDETFLTTYGYDIKLDRNGSVCEKTPTSLSTMTKFFFSGAIPASACAVGSQTYSEGRHKLRMRLEGEAFMGIISRNITPQDGNLLYENSPTVHGWDSRDYYTLDGVILRKRWNGKHTTTGDAYELILDCAKYMLEIKNEFTMEEDEIKVERAPLPWRLFVSVYVNGGRVYLL